MRCMSLFDGDVDGDPRDHECQLEPGHLDAGLPHECECGATWGICCPFCLSTDPNKVGVEKATGIVCRHEFHCPVPGTHGNPFRMCPHCSWSEDGEAARAFNPS